MKYLYLLFITLILLGVSFSTHYNPDEGRGHLLFDKSPKLNIVMSGKNVSVTFLQPFYSGNKTVGILKSGQPPWMLGKGQLRAFPIHSLITEEKYGKLSFSYKYDITYRIGLIKHTVSNLSHFKVLNYLYVNLTISIGPTTSNLILNSNGTSHNFTAGSLLTMNYSVNLHMLKNSSYYISMPLLFQSPFHLPVKNFTYMGEGRHKGRGYSGFNMTMGKSSSISFIYNRTYKENDHPMELNETSMGRNSSVLNAEIFTFHASGTYSNITYDPYIALPVKNIISNMTIVYWKNEIVDTILTNSSFLLIGGIAGSLLIAGAYIYRRRIYGS